VLIFFYYVLDLCLLFLIFSANICLPSFYVYIVQQFSMNVATSFYCVSEFLFVRVFSFFHICVSFLQRVISLISSVAFFSFTSLLLLQASDILLGFNSYFILSAGKLCIRNSTAKNINTKFQLNKVLLNLLLRYLVINLETLSSNTLKTYKVFRMLGKQSTEENIWNLTLMYQSDRQKSRSVLAFPLVMCR